MAGLFKIVPKVGPLQTINFKEPTPQTESLYFKSVDQTIDRFGQALREVKANDLQAPNIDLDTGKPTARGEYPLADYTYREWLDELAADHFNHMDQAMRQNILDFYQGSGPPEPGTRIDKCVAARWRKTETELNQLRALALLDAPDQAPPPAPSEKSSGSLREPVSTACAH